MTTEELFAVRARKNDAGEEVFATEQGTGSDWRVRVFANKFPAVNNVIVPNSPSMSVEMFPFATNYNLSCKPFPGAGIHEVIIDSRMHSSQMVDADDLQVHDWLYTCEQRFWNCERVDPSLVPILFKNQGRASGASQEHPHCQLLASPFIPPILANEFGCSTAFFHETGQVLLTELLARELVERTRIVEATDHFVAYCPFASRFPFELRIAPRRPQSSLLNQFDWPTEREGVADRGAATDVLVKVRPTDPVRLELAGLYWRSIIRLESCLRGIGYNVNIHSAPRLLPEEMRRAHGCGGIDLHDGYCWHIEVTPRWLGIAVLRSARERGSIHARPNGQPSSFAPRCEHISRQYLQGALTFIPKQQQQKVPTA